MKKIYLFSVYFLSILTIGNCITFPTYQASLIESHDISNSVVNPVGFSTDGTFFYILDMDLGNYDSTTGIQSYNYIHLNIYNAADFSLSQNIDITLLLYQLTQNNAIIISEYEGPLVYFQDRILMRGNNNSIFYNIEYDLNTGVFRLISDLPSVSGYFGYNSDASVLWFYNPNNNDFKEYTFNSLTNLFTLSSSSKFNGSDTIVFINNNSIWTFLPGYTIIEGGRIVPDTISKYTTIDSRQPLFKSEINDVHCLPQIIPEGNYIWAICNDSAGIIQIIKIAQEEVSANGCSQATQAFSWPYYFQNFGLVCLSLTYIGLRRHKIQNTK